MRTGDFGVYVDGELYITGRVKDLVIVDGRNHYPQGIESSAQEAGPLCVPDSSPRLPHPANQLPAVVFSNTHSGLKFDDDSVYVQR